MRRKLLALASLPSLLICAATMVAWGMQAGELSFGNVRIFGVITIDREGWGYNHTVTDSFPNWGYWNWKGVIVAVNHTFGGSNVQGPLPVYLTVQFPHWFILGTSAFLPAACLAMWKLGSKRRPGICTTCSYDLTGNTSGVCPECGAAVAGKAGAGT